MPQFDSRSRRLRYFSTREHLCELRSSYCSTMIQPEEKQRPAPGEAASDTMTTKTTTDVVCGKTARACDGCARCRARWYCGADDAFLCQGCDSSVHSANPVARRHQRVRLKTASSPPPSPTPSSCGVVLQAVKQEEASVPAWLNGFRRKARTPRSQGQAKVVTGRTEPQAPTVVPELVETSVEQNDEEEEDEHAVMYRVPVFDAVLSGICSAPPPLNDANASSACDAKSSVTAENSDCAPTTSASSTGDASDGQLSAFLPTDVELAEFAANMESLLSGAVEDGDDTFCMEKLELLDLMGQDGGSCLGGAEPVKAEKHLDVYRDHDNHAEQDDVDASRVTLELSFDLGSPVNGDDAAEEKTARVVATEDDAAEQGVAKTARLRLNYEAIIAAWASQGSSPWTDGKRPQVIKDGRWTEYMGLWMHGAVQMQGTGGGAALDDVGREARVTRYREKRRTRLFSKKIRYEVRKLNAEKRPRIKGRFVKRAPGVALGISH